MHTCSLRANRFGNRKGEEQIVEKKSCQECLVQRQNDAQASGLGAHVLWQKKRMLNDHWANAEHSQGSSLNNQQNWQEKCKGMISDLLLSLGPEAQWFDRPPDKRYIPDYYEKIKKPMDLGSMLQKFDSGRYKEPQSFCTVSLTDHENST